MAVLVTGGAGYIGSHMIRCLVEAQREVVVIDDLSAGHREALPEGVPLLVGDVGDRGLLDRALEDHPIDAVIHFAAKIQVGESVVDPRRYWTGNVRSSITLLEAVLDAGVSRFILSSTAAVYGSTTTVPITEEEPPAPINPYGESKLTIERVLASYQEAYGLSYAALRYFNASGADPDSGIGERHDPETHLIPLVLDAALGRRSAVTVFGRDYPTEDGTCVRDYVHVMDLADAHLAALEHLERGGEGGAFNLGTGKGHSVAEVIATCERVTGRRIPVVEGARRPGDPAVLVASPRRAENAFGWKARRSSLERIVADAWAFHVAANGGDEAPITVPSSGQERNRETPRPTARDRRAEREHPHVR